MKFIDGGVCAAKGFKASGIHVGVKTKNKDKKDLALIVSDCDCRAAAVYTKNVVKAAPLHITKEHLSDGKARAVFANSGNANACAPLGEENAGRMCSAVATKLGLEKSDIIVASTGVIGQALPIDVIESGVAELVSALSYDGSKDAAAAIMTTDLTMKEVAAEFVIGGTTVRIGGIAKGSGMIHPNMGTMLAFLTTDCAISYDMIQKALIDATKISFNRVSVDGDTSTNDMLSLMANGLAGNAEITEPGADYNIFTEALNVICIELAKMIAADGEGATHLITCKVGGAKSEEEAEALSKSVISSTLTKAAIFGADANWGRILCALGYSGIKFDPNTVSIAFESSAGSIAVCKDGRGIKFDEDEAKRILTVRDITIDITMGSGEAECTCWGCDITYDYIKINGDYRT
ncbi:MAG: bifunctional glutamate N-acetyltransferase/amino-acid acetyltransferase ArgJ [Oscillospiraceae bacterium]|jgi:glutamate N-acetyltransferase/amino-acid N-acetyltransferase|nr:bifunctional glutamate N-acetyltransferase/amino-acid acetyltransferase ArgJ [Oscillospiraceae bacterium]